MTTDLQPALVLIRHLMAGSFVCGTFSSHAEVGLHNGRYSLQLAANGAVMVNVPEMPPQRLMPEFTVLWSDGDPQCKRNASHPNYPAAPRVAVRWRHPGESLEALNAWVGSPMFKSATGLAGSVRAEKNGRVWEYRDAAGNVKVRLAGERAFDTTRPLRSAIAWRCSRCAV